MKPEEIKETLSVSRSWHVVLTGQYTELKTKAKLEARGFIAWLPLASVRCQWKGEEKEIHTPRLPRCVFVYATAKEVCLLKKEYAVLTAEEFLESIA